MDTKFPVRKAITPSAPVAPTLPKPGENVVTTAPEPAAPELPTLKINEGAPAVDTKREHELDDMINSHKYYVPIDAIGRKRSIKVSILLTIVAVLLGLILVDFLLDAGSILLSHNVPHTHFFGSEKNT
jgi:hypothetical protein